MENIVFEKIWEDDGLIELRITAISKFVTAFQNCYIQDSDLLEVSKKVRAFTRIKDKEYYIEMGKKEGNYTPAFSMKLKRIGLSGKLKIEVDVEIADNNTRSHRCCYYVEGELSALDRLGVKLNELIKSDIGSKVQLYDE